METKISVKISISLRGEAITRWSIKLDMREKSIEDLQHDLWCLQLCFAKNNFRSIFRVKKLKNFIFATFISWETPKFIPKYHHFNDSLLADFLHKRAQKFCGLNIKLQQHNQVYPVVQRNSRPISKFSRTSLVESLTSPFLLVFAQFCIENASVRTANRLIRLSSNSWVISLIWSRAWRHEHFCASTIAINPLLSVCLLKPKTKWNQKSELSAAQRTLTMKADSALISQCSAWSTAEVRRVIER